MDPDGARGDPTLGVLQGVGKGLGRVGGGGGVGLVSSWCAAGDVGVWGVGWASVNFVAGEGRGRERDVGRRRMEMVTGIRILLEL